MLTATESSLSDIKNKLEGNIMTTETHLIELRLVTENKIELEMGKIRMLGLEVVSSLASLRNYLIILLRSIVPSHKRGLVENIATKSIEWQIDMNHDGKKDSINWRDVDKNWSDIVSSIDYFVQEFNQENMDITRISFILKRLAMLESDISMHLEFLLSGRTKFGDQNQILALRHIQEYEDRLNNAQGNKVYQRHIRKSKSFKTVKSEETDKVNQKAKYQRSKTTELTTLANTGDLKDSDLKKSKSDSSVKKETQNVTKNSESKKTRQRKSSFMDQVTHLFKHVL